MCMLNLSKTYVSISKGFEINRQILSKLLVGRIQLSCDKVDAIRTQTFVIHLNGKFIIRGL